MIKIKMSFPSSIKPDDRMSLWLGLSFFLWFVIYVSTIAFGDSWSETGLMRNKLGKSFPSRISHWYGLNTDTKLNQIKNKVSILKYWNIEKQYWRRKANEWRFSCELLKSPRADQRKGRLMDWLNLGWWSWWGWNAQSLASDLNWKHSIFKFSSFLAVYIYIGFRSHQGHPRIGGYTIHISAGVKTQTGKG